MYQVTPPLVIGLDEAWDTKGIHGYVRVYHKGDGHDKHFCSIKLLLRQRGIQSKIAFIFWGIEDRVTASENQSYEDDALLF